MLRTINQCIIAIEQCETSIDRIERYLANKEIIESDRLWGSLNDLANGRIEKLQVKIHRLLRRIESLEYSRKERQSGYNCRQALEQEHEKTGQKMPFSKLAELFR